MTTTYDAQAVTVDAMLAPGAAVYEIPPFQRRYSWTRTEVSELFDDLLGDHGWVDQDEEEAPYFLGSVVMSKAGNAPYSVLDGQQRITTVSLLLALLRDEIGSRDPESAGQVKNYLFTGRISKSQPKLQLQPEDRSEYLELIASPSTADQASRAPLTMAILKLREMLLKELTWAQLERQLEPLDALVAMLERILYRVEFVRIVAPSESVAFRLFETLNDRGLALSAADLIKNKLFAKAGADYLDEVKEAWQKTVDLVGRPHLVRFLRYFWISDEGHVRKDKLYDSYQQKISSLKSEQVFELAVALMDAAEYYRHIVEPDHETCPWGPSAGEGLSRLVAFRAMSCRTALMACARFAPKHMPGLVRACEAITVRYSVVGARNPNYLERSYAVLARRIRSTGGRLLEDSGDIWSDFREVPADTQFRADFAATVLGRATVTWRTVLIRLNEEIASGETRIRGSKHVHVEHVLPQRPTVKALEEAGLESDEVTPICGAIGNLTLLSGKKNQSVSNGPFSKKQAVFASSEIKLNEWIADQDQWTRAEIEERSARLANLAVAAWPWPV